MTDDVAGRASAPLATSSATIMSTNRSTAAAGCCTVCRTSSVNTPTAVATPTAATATGTSRRPARAIRCPGSVGSRSARNAQPCTAISATMASATAATNGVSM